MEHLMPAFLISSLSQSNSRGCKHENKQLMKDTNIVGQEFEFNIKNPAKILKLQRSIEHFHIWGTD